MAPPIRTRPSFPSDSLSHQEASISLYPYPSRGKQNENHNHRKLTKLITWTMKVKVKSLSRVWLFATPLTVAYQATLSMGFSRQEYWSGLPFPSALSNSMKLWAMPCRPPKTDGSWWRVLNVVHWRREWQTTSVFLPWECHKQHEKSKRQDTERWTPQVGRHPICCWRSGRNNSGKTEEMEPKQKQHTVVDVTGDGSKVWCCKEQYCIWTWNVRSMNQGKL